jgi:catechol 2,3-dioxygenase-like lactoylglutathione lyase family enzyme
VKSAKHAPSILAASVALAACMSSPAATGASTTGAAEHGRFHHVHLNVSDIEKTSGFYQKIFGAVSIQYGGHTPALMAERSFVFLNQIAAPPGSQLLTGVIHVGWSGVDGPSEFEWLKRQGIEFYTPLTPLGNGHFVYVYGPDREVVELWTLEGHHRFNHVHMLSDDPKATAEWFAKVTHSPSPAEAGVGLPGHWKVDFGDVAIDVLPDVGVFRPKERTGAIQPSDGAGIDHVAFSFRDLDAAYARVKAQGLAIEREIAVDPVYGMRHFFVRAPNRVLVELVEAKPLPEAAWE